MNAEKGVMNMVGTQEYKSLIIVMSTKWSQSGPAPTLMPFEITCDILSNGTLNIKWTVTDNRVDTITLDYNCTSFGEVQASATYLLSESSLLNAMPPVLIVATIMSICL